jgi:hypothetical protein
MDAGRAKGRLTRFLERIPDQVRGRLFPENALAARSGIL